MADHNFPSAAALCSICWGRLFLFFFNKLLILIAAADEGGAGGAFHYMADDSIFHAATRSGHYQIDSDSN